jgi:hypothetical protein
MLVDNEEQQLPHAANSGNLRSNAYLNHGLIRSWGQYGHAIDLTPKQSTSQPTTS